jgi:outer membrane usher protein FimD/PapC
VHKVDISRFEHGATALPGIYKADVFVNNMNIGTESIQFKEQEDKSVQLCLSPSTLMHLNLDTEQLPSEVLAQMKAGDENSSCLPVNQLLPWMSVPMTRGLSASICRFLRPDCKTRGGVMLTLSFGITAFLLRYSAITVAIIPCALTVTPLTPHGWD